jgi:hypothetical protein
VKFDTGYFDEELSKNPNFVKIGQNLRAIYIKTLVRFIVASVVK